MAGLATNVIDSQAVPRIDALSNFGNNVPGYDARFKCKFWLLLS